MCYFTLHCTGQAEIVITKSTILSNRSLASINMAQTYNPVLTISCVKKRKKQIIESKIRVIEVPS